MVPDIDLNNGSAVPQIGFGTLYMLPELGETSPTEDVVDRALSFGYRHIDTAQSYGTEPGVGRAIAATHIPRGEIYLTSKLGNANHLPADVHRSIDETLTNLGIDQLDLFLMHWPLPTLYDGDYVSTWAAMNELVTDGRVRTIGVSNFERHHLQRIIDQTGVVPAVNQVELHPLFRNDAAREACAEFGIAVEAWSPLGRGAVLDDPLIGDIAAARSRTSAQVILRWHVQHGHMIIPKSSRPERMAENISIFDFSLTAEEMASIDSLDQGEAGRIGPHPDTFAKIP